MNKCEHGYTSPDDFCPECPPARSEMSKDNTQSTGILLPPTPCCGYEAHPLKGYPVYWNEFNRVMQCHNCGEIYLPQSEQSIEYIVKGMRLAAIIANVTMQGRSSNPNGDEWLYLIIENINAEIEKVKNNESRLINL